MSSDNILWLSLWDGRPDIKGSRDFSRSCLSHGRRRDKGSAESECGILLEDHGGLREIKGGNKGNNQ